MSSKITGILMIAAMIAVGACSTTKEGATSPEVSPRPSASWNRNQQQNQRQEQSVSGETVPEARIAQEDALLNNLNSPPPATMRQDGMREGGLREDRVLEPAAKPIVPAFPVRLIEKGRVSLQTIHFNFDSDSLSTKTREALEANVNWIQKNPQAKIQIEGHCDERGSSSYNLGLGLRRGNQVREYFIKRGIAPHRLTVMSYGEEMPLRYGHDESNWKFNRRVDFRLMAPTARR